ARGGRGRPVGQCDAYVRAGPATSPAATGGGSVALGTGLFGKAAGADLKLGSNKTDEAVVTFADEILRSAAGTPGTAAFNQDLAFRVASTATAEAAHTFGLAPTGGSNADQLLLSEGDQVRQNSDTRNSNNIFTRFALPLDGSTTTVNNYNKLKADPDLGLVDANRNGIP